jgi:hypothetical protein
MGPAAFQPDRGAGHQVTDRAGNQDLTRRGERGDPRSGVHGNPTTGILDATTLMSRSLFRPLPVSGDIGLARMPDITGVSRALIDPRTSPSGPPPATPDRGSPAAQPGATSARRTGRSVCGQARGRHD